MVIDLAAERIRRNAARLATVDTIALAVVAVTCAGVAAAQADDPVAASPVFTLSAFAVMVVTGTVIPIITGLLTKATLSSWWKGLLTVVLTAVTAGITSAVVADGSAVFSKDTLLLWFVGFVQAVASYVGIWKPAGLTSTTSPQVVSKLAPGFGIGKKVA